ncbi:peptidoglycan DD-metalloendopeptidase family protein [Helcobacillus massiliensis]|uniref:M23 family metallopeptidase n=1 Tax=Helcobacillus massiliensis TaxID=521392 RepID=UPI0021A769DB|nr:M23 family metallopeptidase [Helcobacillus massiliensis]MCT1557432.1 peptidoglycan DD-metalloendopeptidase family protein [Helcobacillus massiliensis]MCT2036387.1 peptidoglycan DD-metalloendopeptidase family protein [Helcobacillus massiliensis]MCT2331871.1 peptidoglycan DD-metalloendopeptidase family protein [Helcobacillus massiliensis]
MTGLPSRRTLLRSVTGSALVCGLGTVLLSTSPVSYADNGKKDKQREKESVDSELARMRQDLDGVDQQLADTYLELAQTELQIPEAQSRLDDARTALAQAQKEDDALASRLAAAQKEEKELQKKVASGKEEIAAGDAEMAELSLDAYKGSGMPSAASVFVGSGDPQNTVDRSMNYKLTLQSQGRELVGKRTDQAQNVNAADRLSAVRTEIADLKKKSAAAVKARKKAESDAASAKKGLDELYSQQKKQKQTLETEKTRFKKRERELNKQSEQLNAELERLEKKEREEQLAAARREASRRRGAGEKDTLSSTYTDTVTTSGQFMKPSDGVMTSKFGYRVHPIFHTRKLHAGQDWGLPSGSPVRAMADGKVLRTGFSGGGGNVLEISHGLYNGQLLVTRYLHLSAFRVSPGQTVKKGQLVALSGNTGNSTGPHLHFETRLDGTPVDPLRFIG